PSSQECAGDREAFARMFHLFYRNNDAVTAATLAQKQDTRYLVQTPPQPPLSQEELDKVHGLDFERDAHPSCLRQGKVRALETIRFAIATHRGCYGECNFCAIAVHQGRTVTGRSRKSIVEEARRIAAHPHFKGIIPDVGGPTANMYGFECDKKLREGSCLKKRCLFPKICPKMKIDHGEQIRLLQELRSIPGVRKAVVASGIRYDMILADRKNGLKYLRELVRHHVSGQMKIAPEHSEEAVLACMGKPGSDELLAFRDLFLQLNSREKLNQFLTYYMIAAHPGCSLDDMKRLKEFCQNSLKLLPRQVQVFTPTPSTYSTLMYWTGRNPFTGEPCFVERSAAGREKQKQVLSATAAPRPRGGKSLPQARQRKKWKR
ncbi:MAG TPA: radical SAM protein, partial [Desulfobacteraceae bacterium]|nr:radical SAM protein [Desulfobacteraceae bacterium]